MPRSANNLHSQEQHQLTLESSLDEKSGNESTTVTIADLIREHSDTPIEVSVPIVDRDSLENATTVEMFENNERYSKYLERLRESAIDRTLISVTHESIRQVKGLKSRFPNFSEVIDFISENMMLCLLSKPSYFRIPPIALGGSPGVGKTEFCRQLAEIVGIESEFISCSSSNSDWTISGLERGYSNGHPGKLAEFYRRSKCANPLFIMDEFEKPSHQSTSTSGTGSFFGPFFTLLEPATAKEFQDNYYEVKFDASHINWVMTVNDFEALPEPLQTRLTRFEIAEPDQDARIAICHSIYAQLRKRFMTDRNIRFSVILQDHVAELLAIGSPREMRKALEIAMMRSVSARYTDTLAWSQVANQKFEVGTENVPNFPNFSQTGSKGIGFLAQL